MKGGPDDSYCCNIQFDPTGHWLGALGGANGVPFWDLVNGGEPRSFEATIDFEFGADGTSIVAANESGLTVSDIATGRQLRQIATPPGVTYGDLELDPTGRLASLVSPAGRGARVDVNMQTGEVRKTLQFRDPNFAQFSRDGRRLAVAGNDGVIYIYDTDVFVERERLVGTPVDQSRSCSVRTALTSCRRRAARFGSGTYPPSAGTSSATSTSATILWTALS